MRFLTQAALSLATVVLPCTVGAADLHVTVTDGPTVPATLYLALFDSAQGHANGTAVSLQKVEMRDGVGEWVFSGLPAGRYMVRSFADENGNGKLDKNIVGLPTERYGFSNNAKGRMGPASFDAAAVPLEADTRITFRLQ